ncbi:tyrosine-type recombinase/integrase [Flavobacterium sp. UMI-01]|uniref:tyrosine-type recombinase/integrase n=1 Tax=Flavobacterium sp. UMI-01 TaxID=1441053 RepID=UPI001C7CE8C1|nr:tyrosine-type recombinase/integrase [Flavobacterium sp. UMI-01]GIZ08831.1 integrase [Flavobacterium sp. UMI-01]
MATTIESFKGYLLKEKKYSVHTVTAYEKDVVEFQLFNKEYFQQDTIEQVNYSQIRSWLVSLVEGGLVAISVNRKVASLKAFYKFLLKTKQINVNPLLKHKSLKVSRAIQIPFSEKEVGRVLQDANEGDDFETVRNRLIIELLYSTGMRRAELIQLKMQDVDLAKGVLKVLGKRNKERLIPILPLVKQKVLFYVSKRADIEGVGSYEYFFITKNGIMLNNSLVYRLVNSYFGKASEKVKKSPHVLRHTFATHLLNNGADLNSVKELLGHSSLASTQVYTHTSLMELKKVYKKAHPRNNDNDN